MTAKQKSHTKPQYRPRSTAAIFEDWLNHWQREDHTTFRAAMRTVREYAEAHHWEAVLDIEWSQNADLENQMRMDAQKLRRWFKAEHQMSGPVWFDLVRLVAGAMPSTVRAGFINELFGHTGGLFVMPGLMSQSVDRIAAASVAAKEGGEAVSALLQLPSQPTRQEQLDAKRELQEAIESLQMAMASIGSVVQA